MDPVSIAASCIAFTGACHKLVSGLRFLRDVSQAPEEVLALTDELTDLQNVLTVVHLITRKRHDIFLGVLLSPLFDKVDRIIDELCDTCGACPKKLKEDNDYGEQLKLRLRARFKWTLAKKRVNELRERLKIVRLDFANAVYRVKTPTVLQNLVGSLLIRSNGLYGMNQRCNEHSCRRSKSAKLSISYRFPDWLLNRMVSSVLISNHVNGPQVSLVAPRIVSNTSDIFLQSFAGNIDGVAKLLQSGLASSCDINGMWGYTPLHYALDRGHMNLCRFLLKAGARAEITDMSDSSVTDMAWNKICLKKVSGKDAEELECMFQKDDWLEERQFTVLHKIVLGLLPSPRSLQEELSASTSNIEVKDSEGRTPLSWAAELGDLAAVQTLLEYGAAHSSKSRNGMTPLHYATRAPSPGCLKTLLDHGASVTGEGSGALGMAAYAQNDESFIIPILDHGAEVNYKDCYGSTALSSAVFVNNHHTARCLLSRGAIPGAEDLNVMNDAIENNSHECIALLLDHRAKLSTANIQGETSLHVVARRGDIRTIELFQAAELEDLDAHTKTNEGLTAWDIVRQRLDATEELQSAFGRLVDKIHPNSKATISLDALAKVPPIIGKASELVEVRVEEVLAD
ncbi:MAG: hypothetical protein Q9219_004206 [cf. Caloplaca sp. 3 TL-2023]